jgi:hypothetical protein
MTNLEILVQALIMGAMLLAGYQLGRTFKDHDE